MLESKNFTTIKSVFKSGKSTTTEQEFTQKWIELINTLEEGKSVAFVTKGDESKWLRYNEHENCIFYHWSFCKESTLR